jgi:DNA-nicking Smr family endonuclease
MSKKTKKTPHRQRIEPNNPFEACLKGLPVSDEDHSEDRSDNLPVNAQEQPGQEGNDFWAFEQEMTNLGVKPLNAENSPISESHSLNRSAQSTRSKDVMSDKNMSDIQECSVHTLPSDSGLDDLWPENRSGRQAKPRRMKQLEKGTIRPDAKIDLHGMRRDEASHKARLFLENAAHHGLMTVLIITGKGNHSENGPVLRKEVERLLAQLHGCVLEWGTAPRRYGGAGALAVFLRKDSSEGTS